ncbi:uncharacterized protein [Miscanthus floridulus]|uniref:uncharacterized protein n=1 Tax=Miscanthus floridulus TaxID=154761 RepID=UPI003459C594
MDFVEGFPCVGGKSMILTVEHFIALSHPYSASSVARAFFDNIVRLHGFPCSIVSDTDTVFTSNFWEELFKLAGVTLLCSSAFHPQTDEQSEVTGVLLRLHHCIAVGITLAASSKLGPRFFGPYQIVERLGAVAYRQRLPPKARIHDVFHVALLKKYEGDPLEAIVPLPSTLHGRVIPTPAAVVRARLNRGRWQLLVHWEGRTAADSTWEDIDDFKERYPAFQLADELFVGEEGSVIDAFTDKSLIIFS